MYAYKMVQIPPNIQVAAKKMFGKAPDITEIASSYLQSIVNQHAKEGWEFWRVDTIGVKSSPGCLAAIFGAKEVEATYYVVSFRRQA